LILNTDGIEDNFFSGVRLLGIMSQLKNYRFCWLVNACLKYDFRLKTDVEIQVKKKNRNYFFQVYHFCETDCEMEHYIYHTGYGPTNETLGKYIRNLFGQNIPAASMREDARGSTQMIEHTVRVNNKS